MHSFHFKSHFVFLPVLQPTKRSNSSANSGSVGLDGFVLNAAANLGSNPVLGLPSISSGGGGGGGGPFSRRRSAGFPLIGGSSSGHAAPVNPKKLYDSWLTALRIRTYLANLNVVRDPDTLSQMSTKLEPGVPREPRPSLASSASASTTNSTGAVSGWSAEQSTSCGDNQQSSTTPNTTPNKGKINFHFRPNKLLPCIEYRLVSVTFFLYH